MRTQLLFSEGRERMNGFHSASTKEVIEPWIQKFEAYNKLMEENIDPDNASRSFFPDANAQDPGANVGSPRWE